MNTNYHYHSAFAITPTDNAVSANAKEYKAIYVGGAGNIVLVTENGDQVTFNGVPVGTVLPVRGQYVRSTSTTATNLVGLL